MKLCKHIIFSLSVINLNDAKFFSSLYFILWKERKKKRECESREKLLKELLKEGRQEKALKKRRREECKNII